MPTPTKADSLLSGALSALGLAEADPAAIYAEIPSIIANLAKVNGKKRIAVGTTGAISERLCSFALEQIRNTHPHFAYRRFGKNWKWIGDLLISGDPYDIAVSVKSYKAKERLLASGTGSLLTPTIGWGLFNDVKEWSAERTKSYLYRGFIAIYMPEKTLAGVSQEAKDITNINGRALLRGLAEFPNDIISSIEDTRGRIDCRKL